MAKEQSKDFSNSKKILMNLYKPEKVLITGVSGFIGSHLAERLILEKVETVGFCRRVEDIKWLKDIGLNIIKGDILDIDSIIDHVSNCDIIIHTAGWSGASNVSKDLAWKTNVEGTKIMLALAKKIGVKKFIYISSVAVYGMNDSKLIDETELTPLINELYTDSKITAEDLVKNSGIPYVIIRPGCIYGPRGEGWTTGVVKQIKSGLKLLGKDAGLINLGFINNFIDGVWLVLVKKEALNNTFNINDGRPITYKEFYLIFAKMLGIKKMSTVPEWRVILSRSRIFNLLRILLQKPSLKKYDTHFRFSRSVFSILKVKSILNYSPMVNFEESFLITEKWLKDQSILD
jgi:nucleoside-diphosphate-sugar epimerase